MHPTSNQHENSHAGDKESSPYDMRYVRNNLPMYYSAAGGPQRYASAGHHVTFSAAEMSFAPPATSRVPPRIPFMAHYPGVSYMPYSVPYSNYAMPYSNPVNLPTPAPPAPVTTRSEDVASSQGTDSHSGSSDWWTDGSSSHPSSGSSDAWMTHPDVTHDSRLLDFFLGADEIVGSDIYPWPTAATCRSDEDYDRPVDEATSAQAPPPGAVPEAPPAPGAVTEMPPAPTTAAPPEALYHKRKAMPSTSKKPSGAVEALAEPEAAKDYATVPTGNTSSTTRMTKEKPPNSQGSAAEKLNAIDEGEYGTERKERNRLHSKRSRLRKKIFIESMNKKTKRFEVENMLLRKYLVDKVGVNPDTVLREEMSRFEEETGALAEDQLVFNNNFATTGKEIVSTLPPPDFTLVHSLQAAKQNFVITNPNLPDEPIVYCSQGFLDMTGYSRDEVVGRNCRFLQGSLSDRQAVKKIAKALIAGTHIGTCLVNYKKDGSAFWNYLFLSPLRDATGRIIMNVGVQCEVPGDDADIYA